MDNIKQALALMYAPSALQTQKKDATTFLESFQKTANAWLVTHLLLSDGSAPLEFRMFAAQTLRSKATYDLSQLPDASLKALRGSLIDLLAEYATKDKLIRVQLSLCLCQIALQDLEWHGAVSDITARLGTSMESIPAILEFLKILPEELTLSNKTPLTDQEFASRTKELITDNVPSVLELLQRLLAAPAHSALLLDCLNSWLKECPVVDVLSIDSLAQFMFHSLHDDATFESAADCLCLVFRETKDIDNLHLIDALYQQLLSVHEAFDKTPHKLEDTETFSGLTRIYAEAGEAWHVLIAKNPAHFKPLVQILLQCCKNDHDLDVVKYTFLFWYQLKQMLTLPKFEEARAELLPFYLELIQVIIYHLRYPSSQDDSDLFGGDKEAEDKFKDFRYEMGDVLKDCCSVVGARLALNVPIQQIQELLNQQSGQWQALEAPLFSMRVMAKEVSRKEKLILPTIMSLLVYLPEHPKIRYATTLVLGRYSEWTANSPELLEPQLNYIIKGFLGDMTSSSDVVNATSQALMYFCQDCASLLINYMDQLYLLYKQVQQHLGTASVYSLVDGLSHVIRQMPLEQQYSASETLLAPTLDAISRLSAGDPLDDAVLTGLRDEAEVLTIYHSIMRCKNDTGESYPVADFFINKIWPLIPLVLSKFGKTLKVSEFYTKIIKNAVEGCSRYLVPILGEICDLLHEGFKATLYGCYFWVTGILIQCSEEFSDDPQSVYQLGLLQCTAFFQILSSDSNIDIKSMPDVIEDFFLMASDLLMYFPTEVTSNEELMRHIFEAGIIALDLSEEYNPLMACVHFFVDYVSWALEYPPVSLFDGDFDKIKKNIKLFMSVDTHVEKLLLGVLRGLIYKFCNDTDGNDLVIKILSASPDVDQSLARLSSTVLALPNVSEKEVLKLVGTVSVALSNKDTRRVRIAIKDFVSWYTRKNVNIRATFS